MSILEPVQLYSAFSSNIEYTPLIFNAELETDPTVIIPASEPGAAPL